MNPSGRIHKLVYEYGEFILEERPWGDEWENGDPFPKDKETLGVFLHRKNYEMEDDG